MNDSPEPVDLSPSRAELIARVRARGRQIRPPPPRCRGHRRGRRLRHRRTRHRDRHALVGATPSAAGTVSTTRPPSTVDAKADLTTSIELGSTTLVAADGAERSARHREHDRQVDRPYAGSTCRSGWAVTLENSTFLNEPTFPTICVSGPLFVDPGTTRWPFTILGSYYHCADPARPTNAEPVCPNGSTSGTRRSRSATTRPCSSPMLPGSCRRHRPSQCASSRRNRMRDSASSVCRLAHAVPSCSCPRAGRSRSRTAAAREARPTWTNPDDPKEQIIGATGVELGAWWETDGVKGSIKPAVTIPTGAQVQRRELHDLPVPQRLIRRLSDRRRVDRPRQRGWSDRLRVGQRPASERAPFDGDHHHQSLHQRHERKGPALPRPAEPLIR